VVLATTTNICDSGESHGNEDQYVAALVAGRRLHGAKNNRVRLIAQVWVVVGVND
jgi:hypothetical protein